MEKAVESGAILIADGIYSIAEDISTILSDRGLTDTIVVGTLNEALAAASASRLRLVITECKLGRRWATPLLDLLREKGVPAILTTTMYAEEVPAAFRAYTILAKPVDDVLLLRAVDGVFNRPST